MLTVEPDWCSSLFQQFEAVVMGPGLRRDAGLIFEADLILTRNPMTHPSTHARTHPDKIAYQMAANGKAITYRELDELSNQGAHLFRKLGLKAGDHVALLMENRLAFMEICWAAQRAGLYYTAISRYLTKDEIAYIVKDCGAKVFITTPKCAEQVRGLVGQIGGPLLYMMD